MSDQAQTGRTTKMLSNVLAAVRRGERPMVLIHCYAHQKVCSSILQELGATANEWCMVRYELSEEDAVEYPCTVFRDHHYSETQARKAALNASMKPVCSCLSHPNYGHSNCPFCTCETDYCACHKPESTKAKVTGVTTASGDAQQVCGDGIGALSKRRVFRLIEEVGMNGGVYPNHLYQGVEQWFNVNDARWEDELEDSMGADVTVPVTIRCGNQTWNWHRADLPLVGDKLMLVPVGMPEPAAYRVTERCFGPGSGRVTITVSKVMVFKGVETRREARRLPADGCSKKEPSAEEMAGGKTTRDDLAMQARESWDEAVAYGIQIKGVCKCGHRHGKCLACPTDGCVCLSIESPSEPVVRWCANHGIAASDVQWDTGFKCWMAGGVALSDMGETMVCGEFIARPREHLEPDISAAKPSKEVCEHPSAYYNFKGGYGARVTAEGAMEVWENDKWVPKCAACALHVDEGHGGDYCDLTPKVGLAVLTPMVDGLGQRFLDCGVHFVAPTPPVLTPAAYDGGGGSAPEKPPKHVVEVCERKGIPLDALRQDENRWYADVPMAEEQTKSESWRDKPPML